MVESSSSSDEEEEDQEDSSVGAVDDLSGVVAGSDSSEEEEEEEEEAVDGAGLDFPANDGDGPEGSSSANPPTTGTEAAVSADAGALDESYWMDDAEDLGGLSLGQPDPESAPAPASKAPKPRPGTLQRAGVGSRDMVLTATQPASPSPPPNPPSRPPVNSSQRSDGSNPRAMGDADVRNPQRLKAPSAAGVSSGGDQSSTQSEAPSARRPETSPNNPRLSSGGSQSSTQSDASSARRRKVSPTQRLSSSSQSSTQSVAATPPHSWTPGSSENPDSDDDEVPLSIIAGLGTKPMKSSRAPPLRTDVHQDEAAQRQRLAANSYWAQRLYPDRQVLKGDDGNPLLDEEGKPLTQFSKGAGKSNPPTPPLSSKRRNPFTSTESYQIRKCWENHKKTKGGRALDSNDWLGIRSIMSAKNRTPGDPLFGTFATSHLESETSLRDHGRTGINDFDWAGTRTKEGQRAKAKANANAKAKASADAKARASAGVRADAQAKTGKRKEPAGEGPTGKPYAKKPKPAEDVFGMTGSQLDDAFQALANPVGGDTTDNAGYAGTTRASGTSGPSPNPANAGAAPAVRTAPARDPAASEDFERRWGDAVSAYVAHTKTREESVSAYVAHTKAKERVASAVAQHRPDPSARKSLLKLGQAPPAPKAAAPVVAKAAAARAAPAAPAARATTAAPAARAARTAPAAPAAPAARTAAAAATAATVAAAAAAAPTVVAAPERRKAATPDPTTKGSSPCEQSQDF